MITIREAGFAVKRCLRGFDPNVRAVLATHFGDSARKMASDPRFITTFTRKIDTWQMKEALKNRPEIDLTEVNMAIRELRDKKLTGQKLMPRVVEAAREAINSVRLTISGVPEFSTVSCGGLPRSTPKIEETKNSNGLFFFEAKTNPGEKTTQADVQKFKFFVDQGRPELFLSEGLDPIRLVAFLDALEVGLLNELKPALTSGFKKKLFEVLPKEEQARLLDVLNKPNAVNMVNNIKKDSDRFATALVSMTENDVVEQFFLLTKPSDKKDIKQFAAAVKKIEDIEIQNRLKELAKQHWKTDVEEKS